jgi:shikimate dehydrogenase
MIHLGLIGYPLGHSLSPKIHLAALKACGLDGDYSLFPIQPNDKNGLTNLLDRVRTREILGLNVTIPHKQNVIELMDELTPTAQSIGAVNTIYLRDNKLVGDNTDAAGFLSDLNKFMGSWELRIGKSALVLGAGGSARAVVYALANDGWNITITARRIEQMQQLVQSYPNCQIQITHLSSFILHAKRSSFALLVNTTPLGMTPNIDQSPFPAGISFPAAAIYDLVYNPRETRLVKDAHEQGLQAVTGLGMLIEQAALAFELWTGHNPPRDVLWNAADN